MFLHLALHLSAAPHYIQIYLGTSVRYGFIVSVTPKLSFAQLQVCICLIHCG